MSCDGSCEGFCSQDDDNKIQCLETLDNETIINNINLREIVLDGIVKGTVDVNDLLQSIDSMKPLGLEWRLIKKV